MEFPLPSCFAGYGFEHGYQGAQKLLFRLPQLDAVIGMSRDSVRYACSRSKKHMLQGRVISLTGHPLGEF